MKKLQAIASQKGGRIKEGEYYKNAKTKMKFIDQLDNEFQMTPHCIKSGQWSPYESGHVRDPKYHMKELQEIVAKKSGKIKEGEYYTKNNTKMTFIDQLGNEFQMTPSAVKCGKWSPYEKQWINHSIEKIKLITS